jgi:hypothetical protein
MAYDPYESELFSSQMQRLREKTLWEQFNDAVEKLIEHPELNDGQLKGDRAGTFKKKFFHKRYRIIFKYCQFCLQTKKVQCPDCAREERSPDSIIFLEVFERGDGYD